MLGNVGQTAAPSSLPSIPRVLLDARRPEGRPLALCFALRVRVRPFVRPTLLSLWAAPPRAPLSCAGGLWAYASVDSHWFQPDAVSAVKLGWYSLSRQMNDSRLESVQFSVTDSCEAFIEMTQQA